MLKDKWVLRRHDLESLLKLTRPFHLPLKILLSQGDRCWTVVPCTVIFPRVPIREQGQVPLPLSVLIPFCSLTSLPPDQSPERRNQGPHLSALLSSHHFTKRSYQKQTKKPLDPFRDSNYCRDSKKHTFSKIF